jgi:hypothetical protein
VSLTVLAWWWAASGRRPGVYTAAHVHALARMLAKHMSGEYRLVCVTDRPEEITECETFPLWNLPVTQTRDLDCYRRLKLFEPKFGAVFGERILSLDLDVLIRGDLAPLIDDSLDFQAMRGTCSHINGSAWTLRIGTNRVVWDSFSPRQSARIISQARNRDGSRLIGSDQAWMSLLMPDAAVWDKRHGMWHYKRLVKQPDLAPSARMVAFSGDAKPWDADLKIPALRDEYEAYL